MILGESIIIVKALEPLNLPCFSFSCSRPFSLPCVRKFFFPISNLLRVMQRNHIEWHKEHVLGSALASFSPLSGVFLCVSLLLGHFSFAFFLLLEHFSTFYCRPFFLFYKSLSSVLFILQQYHQNRFSCYCRYEGNSNLYVYETLNRGRKKYMLQ